MAKTRTVYVCQECGRKSPKAMGRCPQCGTWNAMIEEIEAGSRGKRQPTATGSRPTPLAQVDSGAEPRWPMPIGELARVLGGGVVPGSLVLIGGAPGIGKSTLLLQASLAVADERLVLYVSGEESETQIKSRADRLGGGEPPPENLLLLTETHLQSIIGQLERLRPAYVVIDSVQTMESDELESSAGTISQVRESASRLRGLAKATGMAIVLVGHVTKEGVIAGPRVLEHIVDTVLYLEGDRHHSYRLLRAVKNRFGPTSEVGVFQMGSAGMQEVANPSEAFLSERVAEAPGTAVAVTMEGTRPLLVEIQGLTSTTSFGHPRRTANGLDNNRLLLTLAVLSRRVGLRMEDQDVFANVVGGLQVREPAADLALAGALASSMRDRPLPADLVLIGEIGLSGEIRNPAQLQARLAEAAKLGFRRALVPPARQPISAPAELEVEAVRSVREALERAFAAES